MTGIGVGISPIFSGGGFSPFAVGQPIVLFDAAHKTLNGADVSSLIDQSGQGNDLSQGTAADQPLWNASDADFNGNPSVEFDGVSEFLISAAFSGGDIAQPNTIFAVYKWTDNISVQVLYGGLTDAKDNRIVLSTAQAIMNAGGDQNIHTEDTDPHILAALFNEASSDSWLDGTQSTPAGSIGSEPMAGFTLGARAGGASLWANVKVTYMLIYNFELTAVERNYIGRGLAARFGTTDGWV